MTGVIHIVVAMKPLDGNFAENAVKHGVTGLNIDGCRVMTDWSVEASVRHGHKNKSTASNGVTGWNETHMHAEPHSGGRWPANVIHDGSDGVMRSFPLTMSGKLVIKSKAVGWNGDGGKVEWKGASGDSGPAARFFFTVREFEKEGTDEKEG